MKVTNPVKQNCLNDRTRVDDEEQQKRRNSRIYKPQKKLLIPAIHKFKHRNITITFNFRRNIPNTSQNKTSINERQGTIMNAWATFYFSKKKEAVMMFLYSKAVTIAFGNPNISFILHFLKFYVNFKTIFIKSHLLMQSALSSKELTKHLGSIVLGPALSRPDCP